MGNIDLFLQNNDNLLPRSQVRIERVLATVYPDRRRIKVSVDVTPFKERPNFEISIRAKDGKLVAGSSVIASMHFQMEFILHLRGVESDPAGEYNVSVQMYYDDIRSPQDTYETVLHIRPDSSE